MVNGQQAALGLVQPGPGTQPGGVPSGALHQDVAGMPIGVEQANVQNSDTVHILQTEHGGPDLAGVAVMGHKLLQRANLAGQGSSAAALHAGSPGLDELSG